MDQESNNFYSEFGRTRVSLIQRVKEGQEKAWFEFYRRYEGMIRSIGRKNRLSETECDDLMEDVMVIFWRKMDSFFYDPCKGKLRHYLGRIAFFSTLKRRRHEVNADDFEIGSEDYPEDVDDNIMEEWKNFILKEALEELKEGIDSEIYQIFDMSFVQQRSIEEICAITGRSANSIYVIRSRCLKKLRNIIETYRELDETELRRRSSRKAVE